MSKKRHRRATELFLEARELDGAERGALLDRACAGDDELRALVEGMLGVDEATASFLDPARAARAPGSASGPGDVSLLNAGDRVGRYVIREKIGEGGFAVVYAADQEQPVRRKVALKIIKPGMDTNQVIARFEAERQALAMMDHVNVAKVFDAGSTEAGRPYFVMEYVAGTPITEHCDRQRLSVLERLALFRQACDAVQHAHQKGIIHRDIKPSNVLVATKDGAPQVKVIDFGVAKAITQRLTEQTIYTEQGQLIGTPEYMSPEQAEMTADSIDTRSDIYSLGVLLYELLTGSLPFERATLRQAAFAEIQRIIREVEPPKPSTRLSSMGDESAENARRRRLDPKALYRKLHGDLDWIVMKALEKDRTRRYETAGRLADDLRRHLDHEPVVARPPSGVYKLSRFVRRNRAGVAAGSAVALSLLAATVVSVVSAVGEAEKAAELEKVVDFQASMLSDLDPYVMGRSFITNLRQSAESSLLGSGPEPTQSTEAEDLVAAFDQTERMLNRRSPEQQRRTVESTVPEAGLDPARTAELLAAFDEAIEAVSPTTLALKTLDEHLLARAADAIESSFADQPLTEASLRQTLANTYEGLGLIEEAIPHQERALEIRRRVLGNTHATTLSSINDMGWLLHTAARPDAAEPLLHEALEGGRRVLGDDHPVTLEAFNNMGFLLTSQGNLDEAETYFRRAMEGRRRVFGPEHPVTLTSISSLGYALQLQGKLAEVEPYYREALEGRRRVLGEEHPDTLDSINDMGVLLRSQDRLSEAEASFREAVEGRGRVLGDEHPDTLTSVYNLGSLLIARARFSEAEPYIRAALEGRRRLLGADHPLTLDMLYSMGYVLQEQFKLTGAEKHYREALEGRSRVLGPDHPSTLGTASQLGWLLREGGRLSDAEVYLRQAAEGRERVLGDEHMDTLLSKAEMGLLLHRQGKLAEAEPYFRAALDGRLRLVEDRRRELGEDDASILNEIFLIGRMCQEQRKMAEAEQYLREALEGRRRVLGDDDPITLTSIAQLGYVLPLGKLDEAEDLFREAWEGRHQLLGPDHPDTLVLVTLMGDTLARQGRWSESEEFRLLTVKTARRAEPEGGPRLGTALLQLGMNLSKQKRFGEAEPVLTECLEIARRVEPEGGPSVGMALQQLGMNLIEQDRFTDAKTVLTECLEICQRVMGEGHFVTWHTQSLLGEATWRCAPPAPALTAQGRFVAAEALLVEAAERIEARDGLSHRTSEAIERVVALYAAWHVAQPDGGYADKAAEWRAKLE